MSEGEIAILRRMILDLSEKSDRQHAQNQTSQQQDRETFRQALTTQQLSFASAMSEQRNLFQEALQKQFLEHFALDKKVDHATIMLEGCIGDGQPGKGRLGVLEEAMETMKKFRWQALTVVAFVMWAAEVWGHHGK